jgi:hypothetical protein
LTGPIDMRFLLHLAASIAAVGFLCDASPASGHDLPICDMRIVVAEKSMHVELVLNSAELNFFSEIDRDKNGFLDQQELEKESLQISKLVVDCFSFQVDGQPVQAAVHGIVPTVGSHHLTIRAHYPVDARRKTVSLESRLLAITRKSHVIEVTFQRPDRRESARLDAHDQDVLFDYEQEKSLPKNPSTTTGTGEIRKRDYRLPLGLAALLGSFFLFRRKHLS